jgi:hypothetical protein
MSAPHDTIADKVKDIKILKDIVSLVLVQEQGTKLAVLVKEKLQTLSDGGKGLLK